ncbi:hypothetical protein [Nannocystis punicea]|uniref:Uncharacterized protein n=1 Tax=Nannocystis punicea TaxID=2995304 RepID=A0ABY7GXT3_9BACT|nr:hypothetical protein [Nannocystis poenicansa]WAS91684.1 hypothetical protein O0S08_36345 [Nannocystis poenicansa]
MRPFPIASDTRSIVRANRRSAPRRTSLALSAPLLLLAGCVDGLLIGEELTNGWTGSFTVTSATSSPNSSSSPDATDSDATGAATADGLTGDLGSSTSPGESTTGASDSTSTGPGDSSTGAVELDCVDGVAWAKRLVASSLENGGITDMVADVAGNLIAVGYFDGVADLGDGPVTAGEFDDGFLIKLDPLGEILWSRVYPGSGSQNLRSVDLDGDGNILVAGSFEGTIDLGGGPLATFGFIDGFVAKLTAEGDHLWSRSFGGPGSDRAMSIASDSTGNLALLAEATAPVDFGDGLLGGKNSAHVVEYSPSGALLWHHFYNSTKSGLYARHLAVGPDDHVVVVGEFDSTVDFGGGPELGANKAYVLKLDPAGEFVWMRQNLGEAQGSKPFVVGVDIDAANNIHLGGSYQGQFGFADPPLTTTGQLDAWFATLLPDGTESSIHGHGGDPGFHQEPWTFAANSAGQSAIGGQFEGSFSLGGPTLDPADGQAFAARFAADGSHSFSAAYGPGPKLVNVVEIGEDGSVWLTGQFDEPFEVRGELLVPDPADHSDTYLIRWCP